MGAAVTPDGLEEPVEIGAAESPNCTMVSASTEGRFSLRSRSRCTGCANHSVAG